MITQRSHAPRRILAPLILVALLASACGGSTVIEGPAATASGVSAVTGSSDPSPDSDASDSGASASDAADDPQSSDTNDEPASAENFEPAESSGSGDLAQPTADDPTACGSGLPGGLAAFTARAQQSMEPPERLLASLSPISCNLEQTIRLAVSWGNTVRNIELLDDGRLAVNNVNGDFVEIIDPDFPSVVTVVPGDTMVAAGDGMFITHDDNDGLFVWREDTLELGDSSVPERTIDEGNFDGTVDELSIDANGYLVADFTRDRKIGFYSLPEIELIVEFETAGFVNGRPIHLPDGRTLFRGPDDQVHVVHPDTPDQVAKAPASELELDFAIFYDDVLIANKGNDNQIWDLSGEPTNLSTAPGVPGVPLHVLSNDRYLSGGRYKPPGFVRGNDGTVFLGGHTRRITDAVELADGRLATIAADEHIRIWNIDGPLNTVPHPSLVNFRARDVVVLDDGTILSGGQRWTPGADELIDERNYGSNLGHMALSDGGELVLSTGRQLEYFPNLDNWRDTEPLRFDVESEELEFFTSLIISGREAFAGTSRGRVYIWNLDDRGAAEIVSVGREGDSVQDVTVLANGDVAVMKNLGSLFIWSRSDEPQELDLEERVKQIEATPDGRLAVAFDGDFPAVIVLDPDKFDLSLIDEENPDLEALDIDAFLAESFADVVDMAIAPGGRIATSHEDGRITVAVPGAEESLAIDVGGVAFHLAFANDNTLIAVLRSGITVWDVG